MCKGRPTEMPIDACPQFFLSTEYFFVCQHGFLNDDGSLILGTPAGMPYTPLSSTPDVVDYVNRGNDGRRAPIPEDFGYFVKNSFSFLTCADIVVCLYDQKVNLLRESSIVNAILGINTKLVVTRSFTENSDLLHDVSYCDSDIFDDGKKTRN